MSSKTFRFLFTAVVVAGCADPAPVTSDLVVELAMSGPAARHEAVIADVTITNTSSEPMQLLSWYLPASDLQEPLFTVKRDGQQVSYVGPLYKRAQPDASDYVVLAPGGVLHQQVDLAKYYDVSTTGDYTVEVALDEGKLRGKAGSVLSSTSATWIEGRAMRFDEKPTRETCTADQKALIAAALVDARQYSNAARNYLSTTTPSATPRYSTWFGVFSSANWNRVSSNFVAIANAFNNQTVTVDCNCRQKNVYAFVNAAQPYQITVCGAFWTAPQNGTDSKAGTFVHEMSHFTVVAGTDDWAYGKTACLSLASSDPAKAIANADSHEYFAENTPALN